MKIRITYSMAILLLLSLNSCDNLFGDKCDKTQLTSNFLTIDVPNVIVGINFTLADKQHIGSRKGTLKTTVSYVKHRCGGENTVIFSQTRVMDVSNTIDWTQLTFSNNISLELRNTEDFLSVDVNTVLSIDDVTFSSASDTDIYNYVRSSGGITATPDFSLTLHQ